MEVRRAPSRQYCLLLNFCGARALLYAKMLKETENEETRLFLSNLCHWWHFD